MKRNKFRIKKRANIGINTEFDLIKLFKEFCFKGISKIKISKFLFPPKS